ncbi:MAG TPA: amidohydrolase family protein [Gaiellaceae bacterium]|nr:amidohydrolase family protein [Gaiellaceae bacterium]
MTVLDVHRHLWPETLLVELRARDAPPYLRDWTLILHDGAYPVEPDAYGPERLLADLDRSGVDVAVVSCPPTLGFDRLPDREASALADAYHEGTRAAITAAGGRVRAFALGRVEDGFAGVTVAAESLLDLDGLAPLLDEVERAGGVLFVHPGVASGRRHPPWWPAIVDYTAQMQAAYAAWLGEGVDRWPSLRVLFAILAGGAPIQLERFASRGFDVKRALAPTIYLDTASYGRRALELCLSTYGGGRLVFGSDGPVLDPSTSLAPVQSFGQAVEDALCRDNPRELFTW